MSISSWKWTPVVIPVAYLIAVNLAFTQRSPVFAAAAVGVLFVAALLACRGRFAWPLRILVALLGGALVVAIARAATPPVLLFLPPIAIPLGMAWLFGHTLLPGRTPLVERVARAVHAPEVPAPAVLAYARSVTWAWTLLLAAIVLLNIVLVANLTPGGLFELAGRAAPWPVAANIYTWFSNVGTYLLIGGMLAVEYGIRLLRFPDYRFRDPVEFINRVRARAPDLFKNARND